MLLAWGITLPAAGIVGAVMWFVGHTIGGLLGAAVVFAILVAASYWMYQRSKRSAVDHRNVNDEWVEKATAEGGPVTPGPGIPEEPIVVDEALTDESEEIKS